MGWTSYHVSGRIDKKKEAEKQLSCKVVKSAVKGNTWYGACELGDGQIIGAVILMHTNSKDYYNFSYKIVEESMGPCESECPESILKLLTPTENEWANQWRDRCREYNARKAELHKLPIGTKIVCSGKEWEKSLYRGKAKWINWREHKYMMETVIARAGYMLT